MPGKPRVYLSGVPCHVIQRGNDRQPCFFSEDDYLFYLDCLYDACKRYNVSLHAYVMLVGDNRFVEKIEEVVGRNIGYAKRGRPMINEEQGVYSVKKKGTLPFILALTYINIGVCQD